MSDCIEWQGNIHHGYGRAMVKGVRYQAHRLAWQEANGPIPEGVYVLHRCDNKRCVNPDHLFLGTQTDNMRDMKEKGRHNNGNTVKTHCKRGHHFNDENTYIRAGTGYRNCRACATEKARAHRRLLG